MFHNVILEEAIVNNPKKKKYKCPYCDERFERTRLHIHIQNEHEELIPEGYTALRVAFNTINHKTEGHCIICKSVTKWNEDKGRYERLCENPACHEAYRKMAAERNRRIYGSDRLQSDPRYAEEVQRKALEGRKISGKYKFQDGGIISYMGEYEKKFLEFMDKVMRCKSEDIVAPGPGITYMYEGKEHLYLPDFFYVPYNLIIEIKDGGDNKNNNAGIHNEYRIKAKEEGVKKNGTYNYVRVTNNDFGQLLSCMSVCKYNLIHSYGYNEPVFRINEDTLGEDMSGTIAAALPLTPAPMPHESDPSNYYMVQHLQNNVYNYGITKDPVNNDIFSVDPQEKGFYKVFKMDKNKLDKNYLTFKIKDSRSAKELYEHLSKISETVKEFHDDGYYDNYIRDKLAPASEIISPEELFKNSKFELVKTPLDNVSAMKEECDKLYKWLKADPLDVLEEQITMLEDYYTDGLETYNVLPDNIDNLIDLAAWKSRYDSMPYNYRMYSNDLSIDLYGSNNIDRYNKKYSFLINNITPDNNIEYPKDSEGSKIEINNIEESADIKLISYENWEEKMNRVREAESMGLIIMIDPDKLSIDDYSEESIQKLKEKYQNLQSLNTEKRVLSSQTASDILGLDNENLYIRILNAYLSKDYNMIKNVVDKNVISNDNCDDYQNSDSSENSVL